MNIDELVEDLSAEDVCSVEIVPDKRKTAGTEGILNMDGIRGFEYTWRLNAYPTGEAESDDIYREDIQSGIDEYLTARRSLLHGTDFEPLDAEAEEEYRGKTERRAEELAEYLQDRGIETSIDYDSLENPEVNFHFQTPRPKA